MLVEQQSFSTSNSHLSKFTRHQENLQAVYEAELQAERIRRGMVAPLKPARPTQGDDTSQNSNAQ